jgi:hypothetical protein
MSILQNDAYGHLVLNGCSTASLGCCLSASWLHVACAIARPPSYLPAVLRLPLKPPRSYPGTKSRPCGEQTTPTGKKVSYDSPSVCQAVSLPQPVRSRGPQCTGLLTEVLYRAVLVQGYCQHQLQHGVQCSAGWLGHCSASRLLLALQRADPCAVVPQHAVYCVLSV